MTTKKYELPAMPARTVVRIPLGGKIASFAALMKEVKKQQIPTTARLRVLHTPQGNAIRYEWPTTLTA